VQINTTKLISLIIHYFATPYKAFHRFWQAKVPDGGSVLGSSQFSILPQPPPKILLHSKVVKIDAKMQKSRFVNLNP